MPLIPSMVVNCQSSTTSSRASINPPTAIHTINLLFCSSSPTVASWLSWCTGASTDLDIDMDIKMDTIILPTKDAPPAPDRHRAQGQSTPNDDQLLEYKYMVSSAVSPVSTTMLWSVNQSTCYQARDNDTPYLLPLSITM